MVKDKITQKVDAFLAQEPSNVYNNKELSFFWGNCYLRKKEYSLANQHYRESIDASLNNKNQIWHSSGQVNWLVDILLMSGKLDLAEKVENEVHRFYEEPQHDTWPVSFYSLSVIELAQNKDSDFWISKLLNERKDPESYLLAINLNAIMSSNESGFNNALDEFLRFHDRKVKYGVLRETPEGFISMNGMSLVFLAQKDREVGRLETSVLEKAV